MVVGKRTIFHFCIGVMRSSVCCLDNHCALLAVTIIHSSHTCTHLWYTFRVQTASALSVLILLLVFEVDHPVDLFGTVAEQPLQVADKAVDVALPSCLQDYVLVIVVPVNKI